MSPSRSQGDFTGLAADYSRSRPDYAASVLETLLAQQAKPVSNIDFVDVGAGTGIWTRMTYGRGVGSAIAVEPNEDMRTAGARDSAGTDIIWRAGSAEQTGLSERSCDWLTMASSFHWVDFDRATKEFARVLRPGGWFTALWNPRVIEESAVLLDIEEHLKRLQPELHRVSSGRSGVTETLSERLEASPHFNRVTYTEGRHVIEMTPERYIGAWRSVNDVRAQLGEAKFEAFLGYVTDRVGGLDVIAAPYLTRAWSARIGR